ncbi:hypothetical protein ACHAXN_005169 [Cyclotella atomus]
MEDNQSQYKLTEQQLAQIEAEIKSSQPLTSQLLPIDALIQQYSNDDDDEQDASGFLASSRLLAAKYTNLRRIRGDGNCYYRAFLYSLCEGLLHQKTNGKSDEYTRIKSIVHKSLSWVCTLGYEESTIEMFYEELVELIDYIDSDTNNEATMKSQLHDKLNEENSTSDYCTWYLRVLTAAQMKSDPDRFLPFLLAEESSSGLLSMDIPTFCSREVEPMNKECGMVQVAALAECFGVRVKIEYMDGRIVEGEGGMKKVACHGFGGDGDDGKRMEITLLYRPGHYDILY